MGKRTGYRDDQSPGPQHLITPANPGILFSESVFRLPIRRDFLVGEHFSIVIIINIPILNCVAFRGTQSHLD